jgi:hypothetical protein
MEHGTVLKVWAAAALPMGILAWAVTPLMAHVLLGPTALSRALILSMTAGLIWQFFLVVILHTDGTRFAAVRLLSSADAGTLSEIAFPLARCRRRGAICSDLPQPPPVRGIAALARPTLTCATSWQGG